METYYYSHRPIRKCERRTYSETPEQWFLPDSLVANEKHAEEGVTRVFHHLALVRFPFNCVIFIYKLDLPSLLILSHLAASILTPQFLRLIC